jgi:aminodeoxyfutalosine deaminase
MLDARRTLLRAAGAVDGVRKIAPASILIEDREIVAIGSPETIGVVPEARTIDLPEEVISPALINAHVHLDLTGLGPMPCDRGFEDWLARIRNSRPTRPFEVAEAVRQGVEASIRGGVVAVGDIAGALGFASARALADSAIGGISFIEVFGIGRRSENGLDGVDRVIQFAGELPGRPGFGVGIQPHAPYSCDAATYNAAAASGLPVSTHLAETPEEAEFTRFGRGPFLDLLRAVGSLGAGDTLETGGSHPIDALFAVEPARTWLLAHLNYPAEPDEPEEFLENRLKRLADRDATVAFCPRASAFLGHPRPGREGHRWRDYLEAGIGVALGTDGMPCLDTPDRLSVLDEMRFLAGCEGPVDPCGLFRMATIAGARGLGLDSNAVTLDAGPLAGLLAIPGTGPDPVGDLLARTDAPRWLLAPDRAAFGVPR